MRTRPVHHLQAQCDPSDLGEMLANLIDNACKWCVRRVRITAGADAKSGQVVITVDDDGPGLPPEAREVVFRIGERLDERVPGSGLGLPIVRDLAGLYGGEIHLNDSSLGGLQAVLNLPRADAHHERTDETQPMVRVSA